MKNSEDSIFEVLQLLHPVSIGLLGCLKKNLQTVVFAKNAQFPPDFHEIYSLSFIQTGYIKHTLHADTPNQPSIRFSFKHHFLTNLNQQYATFKPVQTSFLEACTLRVLTTAQCGDIRARYPEFYNIENALRQEQIAALFNALHAQQYTTGRERYNELLQQHPRILQIASVKDIAAYLGVHPDSLSRYRSGK